MRTDVPQLIELNAYEPYPFIISTVAIDIDLDPEATRVAARLQVKRRTPGEIPLVLDGEGLALKSVAIDGHILAPQAYEQTETRLILKNVPDAFTLETLVDIAPAKNTALSGLYMSSGRYCTQCEAEGFRRITYWPDRPDVMSVFSVAITADIKTAPILLSNGTPGPYERVEGDRHRAHWYDPHPKPSYLFALCAGDYDIHRDTFTTMGGRQVDLAIHVDKGEANKAVWAMDCLKRAMRWDEDVFAREYDLDVFNIVAVRDFNFGAMENKGLNIFNSAYVLADAETATDADFEAIESIVAHEYFHNWTGNRITCRDWFQLCLKEGLTVFRDQEFSADMRSAPVQRIKDVIRLRARQFPEDAGPLAHAVRPVSYASIDNLYTATVYEKGAELIRMLRSFVGADTFAHGMQIYFNRFDGKAATIEDFYGCFEAASGQDLTAFQRWYAQPGTPTIKINTSWTPEGTFKLRLSQSQPLADGAPIKAPLPIPITLALFPASSPDDEQPSIEDTIILSGKTHETSYSLAPAEVPPYLSINRGFSAPVIVERTMSEAETFALAAQDTDPFNQWDTLQNALRDAGLALAERKHDDPPAELIDAIGCAVENSADHDPGFAALLLRIPTTGELMLSQSPADPIALKAARLKLRQALAVRLAALTQNVLGVPETVPYAPTAVQAGIRALRAGLIDLLGALEAAGELFDLFETATNMTESLATLRALVPLSGAERETALSTFYMRWAENALVLDKWFAAQATFGSIEEIRALYTHPQFDLGNPNRVRALAGVFGMQNLAVFHAPDGSGHQWLANVVRHADGRNPALAARLVSAFEQWRGLVPDARESAERVLQNLVNTPLSRNTADIVARALG